MKLIVILFIAVAVVFGEERETFKVPQYILDKVRKNAIPCADEFNLDHSVILKLFVGAIPDDDNGRKFMYCFANNSGYITDDGHMVVDKLAEVLKGHPLQPKLKEELNKCNKITKENPLATVMALHRCFGERNPVQFSV